MVTEARNKMKAIKKLLGRNTLPREPAVSIHTDTISMTFEKNTCDDLTDRSVNEDSGSVFLPSLSELVDDPEAVCGNDAVVSREVMT